MAKKKLPPALRANADKLKSGEGLSKKGARKQQKKSTRKTTRRSK